MKVKDFLSYLKYNPTIILKRYRDFPYETYVTVETSTVADARIDKVFQDEYYNEEISSIYLGEGYSSEERKYVEGIVICLVENWAGQPWEYTPS